MSKLVIDGFLVYIVLVPFQIAFSPVARI